MNTWETWRKEVSIRRPITEIIVQLTLSLQLLTSLKETFHLKCGCNLNLLETIRINKLKLQQTTTTNHKLQAKITKITITNHNQSP